MIVELFYFLDYMLSLQIEGTIFAFIKNSKELSTIDGQKEGQT